MQFLRVPRAELFKQLLAIAIGQNLEVTAGLPDVKCASQVEPCRSLRKAHPDLPKTIARIFRRHGQQFAALINDGELVDQSLELADQMRRDKDRPSFGIARVVSPN